jgi:ubiquinone/menaquinone biosynthesis C-methylase UbiE
LIFRKIPVLALTGLVDRFISSILKIFFNLLYHQFAWAYDWVASIVSIRRWNSWVFAVLPSLGDSKVLELGCGPGHLQAAHADQKGSIFGLDASQQMLRQASQRLSAHGCDNNLVLGKAQYLPYRDRSFPTIVATFPSNYISDPNTLGEVWRVLENNGELIVLPAAWITGEAYLDKFVKWLFKVTGQSPNFDVGKLEAQFVEPINELEKTKFCVTSNLIELQTSKILLIHAAKVAADSS